MKKLFLLGVLSLIIYSCKKEIPEPIINTPSIVEYKAFGWISYNQDSMMITNGYESGFVDIQLVDSINNTEIIYLTNQTSASIVGGSASRNFTFTTNNISDLTHWIKIKVTLIKYPNGNGTRTYVVYKKHTFHEGNNGYINFNILP